MGPSNINKVLKNAGISIAVPVAIYLIILLACTIQGVPFITSGNFRTFVLNVFYVAFIAWGLYFNISAGRFDFSIGAIVVLAPMVAGRIALATNMNSVGLLLTAILLGFILGAISGSIYVILRLPAMVVSLGVVLILESFTYMLFDAKGVTLIGKAEMLFIIQSPYIYILGAVVLALLIFIVNFTTFGYNLRSLASGQHIAVHTGIKEKCNAILAYAASGAVASIAGVITLSRTGNVSAQLGLASIMIMFQGFLPVFIGGIMYKYSENMTAIFIGAIVQGFVASGFAALGFPLAVQNIFNAFLLLILLIYTMNQHKFREFAMIRERKRSAMAKL